MTLFEHAIPRVVLRLKNVTPETLLKNFMTTKGPHFFGWLISK